MDRRFHIEVTARHVEEVFFKEGAYDVFRSATTQRARRGFLWVMGGGAPTLFLLVNMPNTGAIIGLVVTAMIGQSIILGLSFNNLIKERQHIANFARATAQGGPAVIRIADHGFSVTYKGTEQIERWHQVMASTLADDHVFVRAVNTYIFPKASMPAPDFDELTKLVRDATLPEVPEESPVTEKRPIGF